MSKHNRKMYFLGIASVVILISVWIVMGIDEGESVSDLLEGVVEQETLPDKSVYEIENPNTLVNRVEVMILQTKEDEYKLIKDMKDGLVKVYKDEVEVGESLYQANNSEPAQLLNLEPITGEQFEETELEYKQIADGLVFQMDTHQTREYLQMLYGEGYEIEAQIATSIYNEVYLSNEDDGSYYRIIVVNGLDLTIVSELDDLSMLDINEILQIRDSMEE